MERPRSRAHAVRCTPHGASATHIPDLRISAPEILSMSGWDVVLSVRDVRVPARTSPSRKNLACR
jgi:hypothetical protein